MGQAAVNTPSPFDDLADDYDEVVAALPTEYVSMLAECLGLGSGSRVIDLGCGSGLLSLQLASLGPTVTGVDVSAEMLRLARSADKKRRVDWVQADVSSMDYGDEQYDVAISFESYHLFPNDCNLLRKLSRGVKHGGFIAIGWRNFEWEDAFAPVFVDVFNKFGIEWGRLGYQDSPEFEGHAAALRGVLNGPAVNRVKVAASTSVESVARFLASISKASVLSRSERQEVVHDLTEGFTEVSGGPAYGGFAEYFIKYYTRV